MNKLVAGLVLIIIAGAGIYYFASQSANGNEPSSTNKNTSGMRVEENMVVVMEQRPGSTVKGSVFLAAPGYLVIHEDAGGKPGAILGASALLPAGESSSVEVSLSQAMKDGEKLYAMLHFEKGGNTTFSATEDTPVPSKLGGVISGWFEVSDASLDTPTSI